MDGAITAEMAPPTRPVGTTALAFAGKKPLVKPRSKASMDVRPLVQLLHAGTDETKLLALEAVQSLNVSTQVKIGDHDCAASAAAPPLEGAISFRKPGDAEGGGWAGEGGGFG